MQREADEAEEARLIEEANREINVVKKRRQRMREEFGVNPRKGGRHEDRQARARNHREPEGASSAQGEAFDAEAFA